MSTKPPSSNKKSSLVLGASEKVLARWKQWQQSRSASRSSHVLHQTEADDIFYNLKITSYNIHKCVGIDKVFSPERIVAVLKEINADIVALQEADKRFGIRSGLLDLDLLYKETGLLPVPITPISPESHGFHGNVLFFKQGEITNIEQIHLPSFEPRGALIVEFKLPLGPLRIIATHLGLLHHNRKAQAQAILLYLKTHIPMPTIMVGDLNEWRMGSRSSLKPLEAFFGTHVPTVPSFPTRFPFLALDRVFMQPAHMLRKVETHKSPLAKLASDHLPINVYLDFTRPEIKRI